MIATIARLPEEMTVAAASSAAAATDSQLGIRDNVDQSILLITTISDAAHPALRARGQRLPVLARYWLRGWCAEFPQLAKTAPERNARTAIARIAASNPNGSTTDNEPHRARRHAMTVDTAVDAEALREEVRKKYREVATDPRRTYHFHTSRPLAARLGYEATIVDALPDAAVESFAGVADPLALRPLVKGERIVDVGSGAGFDCFVAAHHVGASGRVVGADMTKEMLSKARTTAASIGFNHVEFRAGLAEDLPVGSGWADVVISNGVINLCADKQSVFTEIFRVLRPGGYLEFADIANGQPVPEAAVQNIDLWTA
jgi:arsenite methyltransferase